MFNCRVILSLLILSLSFPLYAARGMADDSEGRACGMIAKACAAAGFARDKTSKRFWLDCMKPAMLGQTVQGVKIDPNVAKECRMHKVQQMKRELYDLQQSR